MAELVVACALPRADLKGGGSANYLHQAVESHEDLSQAELLLPCARGYFLRRATYAGAEPAAAAVALGEGEAAVSALARSAGPQPCIAIARSNQPRLELWRLGVLLEACELPGICRALSWQGPDLGAATAAGAVVVSRATGDDASTVLKLEPCSPTLALAWLDGGQSLAVAFSEEASGESVIRIFARARQSAARATDEPRPAAEAGGDSPERASMGTAQSSVPLSPHAVRTVQVGVGRVCALALVPGMCALAVSMSKIRVSLKGASARDAPSAPPALVSLSSTSLSPISAAESPRVCVGAAAPASASELGPASGGRQQPVDECSSSIDLRGLRTRQPGASLLHPLFNIGTSDASESRAALQSAARATSALLENPAAAAAAAERPAGRSSGEAEGLTSGAERAYAALHFVHCACPNGLGEEEEQGLWPPGEHALGSELASPNMLACARLHAGGRAVQGQWVVAVGSSQRGVIELWRVRVRGFAAERVMVLELPPRNFCHGLTLGRSQCLVLCSKPVAMQSSFFSAHFCARELQLQAFQLDLQPMAQPLSAQPTPAPPDPACHATQSAGRADEALAEVMHRLRVLSAAYSVEWGEQPLISVDECTDAITLHLRFPKVKRPAP